VKLEKAQDKVIHPEHGLITFKWLQNAFDEPRPLSPREKEAVKAYIRIKKEFIDKGDWSITQFKKARVIAKGLEVDLE